MLKLDTIIALSLDNCIYRLKRESRTTSRALPKISLVHRNKPPFMRPGPGPCQPFTLPEPHNGTGFSKTGVEHSAIFPQKCEPERAGNGLLWAGVHDWKKYCRFCSEMGLQCQLRETSKPTGVLNRSRAASTCPEGTEQHCSISRSILFRYML